MDMTKTIVESPNQKRKKNRGRNIGIYFQSLSGKGGGAERQLICLASALSDRGHNIHIITWDECSDNSFFPIPKNVSWHKLGSRSGFIGKLQRTKKLLELLICFNIKLLIGFVMANNKVVILSAILSLTKLVAAERNGPIIYHIKHTFIGRWINFLSLLACDHIVVQFESFKAGYPVFLRARTSVIPNPIFPGKTQAKPGLNKKKSFQMLFLGRLDSLQKQPEMLIKAFAKIAKSNPRWNLLMVGEGDARNSVELLIKKTGLTRRIKLLPSRLKVNTLYEKADLFVIPSLWEGSPNSLTEAMAHGLPAVGFDVDGVRQLIKHNVTGWIAPDISETALSNTLSKAIKNPNQLAQFGKAAKTITHSHKENMVYGRWQKLIESVC